MIYLCKPDAPGRARKITRKVSLTLATFGDTGVRHEASRKRVEVKDLHHWAVAAVR